jgi:integrase
MERGDRIVTGHIRARSGSFELRYSLGADPVTGRRKTATATIKGSRRDAEKELRRLLHQVDTGEHVDPTRASMQQYLEQWLKAVQPALASRSYERYATIVSKYLIPGFGAIQVNKLTPAHLQQTYSSWSELSAAARRYNHTILRAALENAVEMQLIARNPADVLRKKLPKRAKREMVVLTAGEVDRLLDGAGALLYIPTMVALATGARRGEILAIRWRNVDLDRGVIRIVESAEQTKTGITFKPPKGNKTRSVTLPASAIAELRDHKRIQAEQLLRLGIRQTCDTLVCAREDGSILTPWILTGSFTRLVKALALNPSAHFHTLRHTHATRLLENGVHPKIAQERLGHATVAMTIDLYSHVTPSMQEEAAAKIDTIFRRPGSVR